MACGSGSGTPPMHLQLNAITRYFFLAKSLHAIELDLVEFNEQMQGNIKFLSFFGPNIKFLSQKQKEASSTQEERKKDPSAIFSHIKYVSLSSALSLLPTIKPSRSLCSQKEKIEDYSHTPNSTIPSTVSQVPSILCSSRFKRNFFARDPEEEDKKYSSVLKRINLFASSLAEIREPEEEDKKY